MKIDDELLINIIKEHCKCSIKRIDKLIDNDFATDVDYGMSYAFQRILDIIENGGVDND